jgi:NAD(P)-dependent dehydrogenase (short-subunit alcohol dehydrogenase family)
MTVFAAGLLYGRAVALAGEVPDPVARALADLGARVERVGELAAAEEAVGEWARSRVPLNALVCDAAGAFGRGGDEALLEMMREAWTAVREVAVGALIDADGPGKIILLGPRRSAGPCAEAACAALENLARTLSVEWARHGVTSVMVSPGQRCQESDLAEVICFLCSAAGEYFSGCRLELGG